MANYDLKKFVGPRFIKPDHVRDKPLRDTIAVVKQGKYEKLELVFESGDTLSLNATNTETLMNAYGRGSDSLIGKEIEMYLGQLKYNGADHDAVLIKPITEAPYDDEIPF
jgi:hypothetical protein